MSANTKTQKQRKVLVEKRAAESKVRKERRKAKGRAKEAVEAVQRSPAGKKAAEMVKERRLARRQGQANYRRIEARAATRLGGRRKQTQAELHDKIEE